MKTTRLKRKRIFRIKATDQCQNCGDEFANHTYVKDSITKYKCPHPYQDSGYGGFNGGDPRNFSPDWECCSEKEIANHKAACALWDEAEERGEIPEPEKCPSGWIFDEKDKVVAHVLRSSYGIGVYTIEFDQFFKPREHNYESGD